jgi:hypothetical protein
MDANEQGLDELSPQEQELNEQLDEFLGSFGDRLSDWKSPYSGEDMDEIVVFLTDGTSETWKVYADGRRVRCDDTPE